MGIRLLSAAFALAFASAAFAQTPSVTLRGTIETVSADGGALTVKTRAGEAATVRVSRDSIFCLSSIPIREGLTVQKGPRARPEAVRGWRGGPSSPC